MNLQFKNQKIFENFVKKPMHPKLKEVFWWSLNYFWDVVVTSAYRENDSGVHGTIPYRGIDIRSYIYPDVEDRVKCANATWDYGKKGKKVFLYHDAGSGNHIHIQVSMKTKRNGDSQR